MPEILTRTTAGLTADERAAVARVISESFDVTVRVEQVADYYCNAMPTVLLAQEHGRIVGFQFYRDLQIDGTYVCQFSLAGKSSSYGGRGLQRAFGARIMRQSAGRLMNPFRRIAIAGISNNPKTYRNMLLIGGDVFPDVTRPGHRFRHTALYEEAARRLNITGLELTTGVVRDRCASLGLYIKQTAYEHRQDAINEGFMKYIDNDTNHGIFTMAVSTPVAAIASFASRQLGVSVLARA